MIVETSLKALQAGQQVQLAPGDVLRITTEITTVMPATTYTELWASLVVDPFRDYTVKRTIILYQSSTERLHTEVIDVPITTGAGLKDRVYDLWVELPSYDLCVKILSAVLITGTSAGAFDLSGLMGMMMIMMMMGMIMPMMEE